MPVLSYAAAGPAGTGPAATLPAEALVTIRASRLDFILSFARGPVDAQLLAIPRWGVWGFEFGKLPAGQPPPVSFWEIYNNELLTTAALCQLAAAGPGKVLKRGFFRTKRHSPSRAADGIYEECAHWPADAGRQLLAGLALAAAAPGAPPATRAVAAKPPAGAALVAFGARVVGYKLQELYRTFLVADQWNIGVVNRPIQDFLQPAGLRGEPVDAPPLPSRNVFYADCFARQEATGPVVYFERYDYRRRRGTIARLPYPWPRKEEPAPVLDFPYHLSYPFLHGPYCIPEAWVTNSIRLYDLRTPVLHPAAGHVLLPVPGVDATLLAHQGRYWLFYTRTDRDAMLNLFIAYADAVHGPWHEHPQNPVKTDIRSARPAGPFFEVAGRLYRPAQDCARDYGYAVAIQEVLTLTTTDYAERAVAHIPSLHPGYPAGLHTLAALDATRTLIDFKRTRFIPMATLIAGWGVVSGIIYGKKGRRKPPAIEAPPAS
ncbi:MAG: hypothetical protein EOO36_00290 [Cytophagaceae bacterium]|nr:MAG: hypothetical protein EOO36_00290 [Cytophagaceae bacterium]